ncbi:MAG: outer membrane beta-barrel protein [Bacteroidales bacterium]
MKNKILIISLLFLISSLQCLGQEKKTRKFELGPKVGLSLGAAIPFPLNKIPKGATAYPQINALLGVFSFYHISDFWCIGTGFDLSKNSFAFDANVKSQKYISTSPLTGRKQTLYYTGPTSGNFEFDYILFPIKAKFKFSKLYTATFGIYFSYVYFQKFEIEAIGGKTGLSPDPNMQNPTPRVDYDFNDDLSNFEWGLSGAVQRKILNHLFIELELELSPKTIFKKGFDSIDYKLYPFHIQIGLSYDLL